MLRLCFLFLRCLRYRERRWYARLGCRFDGGINVKGIKENRYLRCLFVYHVSPYIYSEYDFY